MVQRVLTVNSTTGNVVAFKCLQPTRIVGLTCNSGSVFITTDPLLTKAALTAADQLSWNVIYFGGITVWVPIGVQIAKNQQIFFSGAGGAFLAGLVLETAN